MSWEEAFQQWMSKGKADLQYHFVISTVAVAEFSEHLFILSIIFTSSHRALPLLHSKFQKEENIICPKTPVNCLR